MMMSKFLRRIRPGGIITNSRKHLLLGSSITYPMCLKIKAWDRYELVDYRRSIPISASSHQILQTEIETQEGIYK